MRIGNILQRLLRDPEGGTAVEYGFIIALIVVALIAVINGVANETIEMWVFVQDKVTTS